MIAEIIGVGAALAEDGALAANTRLLEKELGTCGIEVGASAAVGTSVQSLRAAIARALGRSDVVILMGGLGPGPDGIAKETVCEGLSRRLVMHEPSLKRMKEAYERAGRQMPQQVARLAMMPEQSVVFPGVRGVTPGCALSAGNQFLLMVPEDPREFVPMFQHSVMPYLAKFSDAAVVTQARWASTAPMKRRCAKSSAPSCARRTRPSPSIPAGRIPGARHGARRRQGAGLGHLRARREGDRKSASGRRSSASTAGPSRRSRPDCWPGRSSPSALVRRAPAGRSGSCSPPRPAARGRSPTASPPTPTASSRIPSACPPSSSRNTAP